MPRLPATRPQTEDGRTRRRGIPWYRVDATALALHGGRLASPVVVADNHAEKKERTMRSREMSKLMRAAGSMLLFAATSLSAGQSPRASGTTSGTWSERGPELGGRLSAIVASHSDPNLLLTASPGGGVWRSTDGGKTWRFPANVGLADFSVTHLEWDLTDSRKLFALTWNGLYASTNNADAWTELINPGGDAAPLRQGEIVSVPDPEPFVQMAFSERERVVVAAVPCSGIYYSFDGTHFTQHWPFPREAKNPDNCIGAIAADPVSHTVYIASSVRSGLAHLFRSSCGSAAWAPGKPCLTWVPANTGMPPNSVVSAMTWVGDRRGAKPGPGALVALVVSNGANGTIYVSRNGTSWNPAPAISGPTWTPRGLVSPGTGQDLFQANVIPLYSGNLGATWTALEIKQQHPDTRDFYADAKAGKVWLVNDGSSSGAYANVVRWDWKPGSPPIAGTGVDLGFKGLKVWQVYFAGVARTSNAAIPVRVFLGSQDNGSVCSDSLGASGWKTNGAPPGGGSGDQFAYQAAPSNPNRAYAWSGTEEGFARTNNAGSATSCDAVAWTFVKPAKTGGAMSPPYFWTHHSLAVHPANPEALYLAMNFAVGVITNAGSATPNLVSHPLPNRAEPSAVYVDAKGAIYAGTQASGAFFSKDNGNTWVPWALNANPPFLITAIVSSGGNLPTFWIASTSGLYRKSPGAAEWTMATQKPGYTVSDVKVDLACPTRVYAAFGYAAIWGQHRGGVVFSTDNGDTWTSITSGYPIHNVPITDLEIDPSQSGRLLVATFGRGFWVYDWGSSLPACKR